MPKLPLGDRMKAYERACSGGRLLPLVPACARIDGKTFHTFTRGLGRPYDPRLSSLMIETARYLVEETNARVGYTQSDEISLVWYESDPETQLFFDGKVSKLVSVLAAMSTGYFNRRLPELIPEKAAVLALFDARVWSVPTPQEAINYLFWREQDATRNSINMAASSVYSHNQLMGVNSDQKQQMLWEKGINWNDYPAGFKRGTYVQRREVSRPVSAAELEKLPPLHDARRDPELRITRREVAVLEMPPLRQVTNRVAALLHGVTPTTTPFVMESA